MKFGLNDLPKNFGCRDFELKHLIISEVKTNNFLIKMGLKCNNLKYRTYTKNEWYGKMSSPFLLATQKYIYDEGFGFGIDVYLRSFNELCVAYDWDFIETLHKCIDQNGLKQEYQFNNSTSQYEVVDI
jgi:hypothetical protein